MTFVCYDLNTMSTWSLGPSTKQELPPRRGGSRLADDRYCAPCGWLFWSATDAQAHRQEMHREQARYEARAETLVEAPAHAH